MRGSLIPPRYALAIPTLLFAVCHCKQESGASPSGVDARAGGTGSTDARVDVVVEAGAGKAGASQDAPVDHVVDSGSEPFLAWVNDPAVWSPLNLPSGVTPVCPEIAVAASNHLFPFTALWEPCGEGCAQLRMGEDVRPTRRVDQISVGMASRDQEAFPLAELSDTDYEFEGPPPTFEVVRWLDLTTLEVLGANKARIEGVGCYGHAHMYEDPRITSAHVMSAGERKRVLVRLEPKSRTTTTSAPFSDTILSQFMPTEDAGLLALPVLSAIFYDGKTILPVEDEMFGTFGSGRRDIVVWRWGSGLRGWRNDGLGARNWIAGLPDSTGPLSVTQDRIVGTSRVVDGEGKTVGTRFWYTDSQSIDSAVHSGPIVVPFHVGTMQAFGDWAAFDGGVADGVFFGLIRLSDFRVWRIRRRSSVVDYVPGTFTVDGQHAYFPEKHYKHENRTATAIVRYDLSQIETLGEPQSVIAP